MNLTFELANYTGNPSAMSVTPKLCVDWCLANHLNASYKPLWLVGIAAILLITIKIYTRVQRTRPQVEAMLLQYAPHFTMERFVQGITSLALELLLAAIAWFYWIIHYGYK